MRFNLWTLLFLVAPLTWQSAEGHAVEGALVEGAIGVRFVYEGGAPVRSAEVQVWSPAKDDTPYAQGLTDRDGSFAFVPGTAGTWRVEMNDGMGHRDELHVDVDVDGTATAVPSAIHSHDLTRWLVGLAVIFGVFGCWALWGRRVQAKGAQEKS